MPEGEHHIQRTGKAHPQRDLADGTRIVAAAVTALAAVALWIVVLALPYADLRGQSFRLTDGTGALRAAALAPRLIGMALVTVAAVTTLVRGRRRAPWWATSGALLGLTAFAAYWWTSNLGTRAELGVSRGPAWYLDGVACAVALVAVTAGASALRYGTGERTRHAPYAAVAAAVVAGVAVWLMGQTPTFLPAMVQPDGGPFELLPDAVRLVAGLTGAALVAVPVLAALARSAHATAGLVLGWLALLTPLVTYVVTLRSVVPLDGTFAAGLVAAAALATGLLAWSSLAARVDPEAPRRSRAERRQRDDSTPLQF